MNSPEYDSKLLKLFSFILFNNMTNFTSSVITKISDVVNNQVTIEFKGKPYTYTVSDVNAWQNDLNDVIEGVESVGAFVNRAVRSDLLQLV